MSINIYIASMFLFSMLFGTRVIHHPSLNLFFEQSLCDARDVQWAESLLSESQEFMIHFNDPLLHDYAQRVGAAADSSKKVIVDIMGFREEIKDADEVYDIYIKDFNSGTYGRNCKDQDGSGSSWIEIDDDYSEDVYLTYGDDAMSITVAHEYFHATQRAYIENDLDNTYFFELSAVWIEDIVFPDVNDYILFTKDKDYFDNPEKNIDNYSASEGYSLGLFGHYLNRVYDQVSDEREGEIMQRIWDKLSEDVVNPRGAVDWVLKNDEFGYESSFSEAWVDWNARNLFSGILDNVDNDIYYYIDQSEFGAIYIPVVGLSSDISYDEVLDNASVSIKSFNISSPQYFVFSQSVIDEDISSLMAIVSDDDEHVIKELELGTNSQIYDSDDTMHLLHAIDSPSNLNLTTDIQTHSISAQSIKEITVYPNPYLMRNQSIPELSIILDSGVEIHDLSLSIYNLWGQLIDKYELGDVDYNIDGEQLIFAPKIFGEKHSSGIYILTFDINGHIFTEKITLIR